MNKFWVVKYHPWGEDQPLDLYFFRSEEKAQAFLDERIKQRYWYLYEEYFEDE